MKRFITLLVCLALSPYALATDYTYTRINVPGSAETQALGINARGEIVGMYLDDDGTPHSFLLRKGVFSEIKVPGALDTTEARQINARGDIVGEFVGHDDRLHGFLLSEGKFTRIDHPRGVFTGALGINNAGDVVGIWTDNEAGTGGDFILRNGRFINVTGGNVRGIQDNGRVHVGAHEFDAGGAAGYISRKPGEIELIEYPDLPFPCTAIRAINQRGEMVGGFSYVTPEEICYPPLGDAHGFLYRDGEFTSIDVPFSGAAGTDARGINDDGVIVGRYVDRTGAIRGFRASPKN